MARHCGSARHRLTALAALALLAPGAMAETNGTSLFFNEARVPAAVPTKRATGSPPSRIVRADLDGLAAIRDRVASGEAEPLQMNLLHGVEFEASIERSAPTSSGYSLSGPLRDAPFGSAVLVVNGDHVAGRVYAPEGVYAIRTIGDLQTVERMTPEPWRCLTAVRPEQSALWEGGAEAPALIRPAPRVGAAVPSTAKAGPVQREGLSRGTSAHVDAEGNVVVDLLVAYPSFAREIEGGHEHMLAHIDLDIATANRAYAVSGVGLRVELAAAVEVEYDAFLDDRLDGSRTEHVLWTQALEHLSGQSDGHMDELHALRDRHAADFVLLHLGGDANQLVGDYRVGGIAWSVPIVSGGELETWGFSVVRSGSGTVLAHELGHSMGLMHERLYDAGNEPFPYSHGFVYELVVPRGDGTYHPPARYGTIMAALQTSDFRTERDHLHVLAFSDPNRSHPQHPDVKLGVPGDQPSSEPDGPADAARHLNELREVLGSVRDRTEADPCRYTVSGDSALLPAEGGTYRIRVETGAGCDWTVSAGEWVASVSEAGGTGSGEVEYQVAANDGFERPVEVLVAGQLHARRQAGSRPIKPVCERPVAVWSPVLRQHPDYGPQTACDHVEYSPSLLASIRHLSDPNDGYVDFRIEGHDLKPGDFDGLTGVVQLDVEDMESVPPDLFSGMVGLRFLRFRNHSRKPNTLRRVEPGAFRDLPGLLRLEIDGHRIRAFEPGAFEGMPQLRVLTIEGRGLFHSGPDAHTPVTRIEPGAMAGLSNLHSLWIRAHRFNGLETGVFSELGALKELYLPSNGLKSVAPGAFEGLHGLRSLLLAHNELESLVPGTFDGLHELRALSLAFNKLEILPSGLFADLGNLESVSFWHNRLKALEPDAFSGLTNLGSLSLSENALSSLPTGLFEGLGSLGFLNLDGNRLGMLRSGMFGGLYGLRMLRLHNAGVTALEPEVFDAVPNLGALILDQNRLWALPPGVLEGLGNLALLVLNDNPGTPFTFAPRPVPHLDSAAMAGNPVAVKVEVAQGAPFNVHADLAASGGSLNTGEHTIPVGSASTAVPIPVIPDGDGPVTVRIDGQPSSSKLGCGQFIITFAVGPSTGESGDGSDRCYRGTRLAAGPPLTLYGIEDRALTLGRGPEAIDLASVFAYFLGAGAEYAVSTSNESVAEVTVEDGALTVTPRAPGTSTVTVTGTGADGETRTREFSVTVGVPSAPLFLAGSAVGREGFVRLINRSDDPGDVRITAVDDAGVRRGPITLRLAAHAARHFNSGDLERGNESKGLSGGVGVGEGDWRLEFESALDIEALAYVRTRDGFLTGIHHLAPRDGDLHLVATFNPASNTQQASRLRVANLGPELAEVTVRGVDDAGESPGDAVQFAVDPGAARTLTAVQLESGATGLDGALGDGEGKWRLEVESAAPIEVMSLLENVRTGHLTNLSASPVTPDAGTGVHHLGMFPAASGGQQGFARVANRSQRAGTVRINAFDDAGRRYDRLELALGAGETVHFNSDDLELGNAAKGLSGSTGPGEGDWRLELSSDLDIEVSAYVRADDGFLTTMHDTVTVVEGRRRVVTFNPGSNYRQVSRLRLVNPSAREIEVAIYGIDDRAWSANVSARVDVPAFGTLTLASADLEAGIPHRTFEGHWERWPLGDGTGKWRLNVTSDQTVRVMSLLESPTGHLTNLSAAPR